MAIKYEIIQMHVGFRHSFYLFPEHGYFDLNYVIITIDCIMILRLLLIWYW